MSMSLRPYRYPGESAFAFLALLVMIGFFRPLFTEGGGNSFQAVGGAVGGGVEGTLSFQLVTAAIYVLAAIILLARPGEFFRYSLRNNVLLSFLAFVLISALWSDSSWVSFRRGIALTGTSIFGIYLALRFKPEELLSLLAWAFLVTSIVSLIFVVAFPQIGIHVGDLTGAWRGGLVFKNYTGRIMTLGALVLAIALILRLVPRPVGWVGFILCSLFVVMAQSRTAWVAAIFLAVLFPFLRALLRSKASPAVSITIVAVCVLGGLFVFFTLYFEDTLGLIGRDTTLTGRTAIWQLAVEAGWKRPWLGAGYRSFFVGATADEIYRYLFWGNFAHGHNSFLDMWLELGFAGLAVFAALLGTAALRTTRCLATAHDPLGLWYTLFLAFLVTFGLVAQVFPQHGTIIWVLFTANLVYLTPKASYLDRIIHDAA